MNIQKTMLATALLAFLTGCGSSGGGSSQPTSNNEVKNDQATQAQVEKQKNEVQALKTQLAQAQSNQKQIEEKLKLAEQSHKKDLSSAKANLDLAQDNLNKAQLALKQAEFQSTASQKERDVLQKQLRQAEQDLSKAQQEKLLAEKELSNKLTEENKLMSRKEVLDFALHNGLHTQDSEEFADDFQNKPKSYVIDQLLDVHKIIAIKNLARRYGLPETDVRQFAKENKNKTLEESAKLLDSKKEEIAQKREALSKEVFELAKAKGLEEWEARNFAYGRHHSDKAGALEDLNKYLTEKAERETKINELINLAKEKGLEEWEASNFAYNNIDNERSKMLENLNQLAVEKEKQKEEQETSRLQAEKEQKIRDLAEQYRTNYFGNVYFDTYSFSEKYKNKTLEEAKVELEQFKSNREKVTELAKVLKDLKLESYIVEQFINDNTFVSLDTAKVNLDSKVAETINVLKNSGNPSYGTPLNKPLGFLPKDDLATKQDPIVENDRETGRFTTTTTYSDIYNQKYSVITGKYNKTIAPYKEVEYYHDEGDNPNEPPFRTRDVSKTRTVETYTVNSDYYGSSIANGFKTPVEKFPTEGNATYTGVAFDSQKQGEFTYTVNFADKKGSGKITGLEHIGDITLQEAEIYKSASNNDFRVKGDVVAEAWKEQGGVNGRYAANFFGPNAEEIAGKVSLGSQGMYKNMVNYPDGRYDYVLPDKYLRDVTIPTDNNNAYYNNDFTPRGNVDIGFGGTRDEIQK